MYQKRGLIAVVVILLVINAVFAVAESLEKRTENNDKHFAIRAVIDGTEPGVGGVIAGFVIGCVLLGVVTSGASCIAGGIIGDVAESEVDCSDQENNGQYTVVDGYASECSGIVDSPEDARVNNKCIFPTTVPRQGCRVFIVDPDNGCYDGHGPDEDGCGQATVKEGTFLKPEYTPNTFGAPHLIEASGAEGSDGSANWLCALYDINKKVDDPLHKTSPSIADYRSGDGFEYICSYDHHWHACKDTTLNTFIWAGDDLYLCEMQNGNPVWSIQGKDKDHDRYVEGSTPGMDCYDDPLTAEQVGDECPTIPDGCNYQTSKCAICINPGAVEVCGDQLNNDCKGNTADSYGRLEEQGGNTPDLCHANEFACEGTSPRNPIDPEDPEAVSASQTNIYGKQFSWLEINDPTGGYCCGYGGLDDHGEILSNNVGDDYACLNRNKDVIGYDDESPDPPGWRPECKDDWCWVAAESTNSQFKVVTIRKDPAKPYDIVSNGHNWVECSENNQVTNLDSPVAGGDLPALKKGSSRFQCYQAGNTWAWAECGLTAGSNEQPRTSTHHNIGIKGRSPGEGLYTLPLTEGGQIREEIKEQAVIQISADTQLYEKHYGNGFLFDFSGYDYLNFMVKFKPDFVPPANIKLTISGPGDRTTGGLTKYFEKNVLGDVINNPLFSQDNYMHIQVALPKTPELRGVKQLLFESTNFMTMRNVYLSSAANNFLCSGQEREVTGQYAWLTDIDEGDPTPTAVRGEDLCRALYGPKAWLGNDLEVSSASANCCGNADNEYYGGDSKLIGEENPKKYSCWNGQPVASGETIMDVEFNVVYDDEDFSVSYPMEDIDINIMQSCRYSYRYTFTPALRSDSGAPVDPDTPTVPRPTRVGNVQDFANIVCPGGRTPETVETLTPGTFFLSPSGDRSPVSKVTKDQFNFNLVYSEGTSVIPVTLQLDCHDEQTLSLNQVSDTLTKYKISLTETIESNKNPVMAKFNDDRFLNSNCPIGVSSEYKIINNNPNTEAYWLDRNGARREPDVPDVRSLKELKLMIELDQSKYTPASQPVPLPAQSTTQRYTCNQEECLYPLPGKSSSQYRITNRRPGLYDLYFVKKAPGGEELIPSEGKNFNEEGNIRARKVSQQVLFYNDDANPGFFGCSATDFVVASGMVESQNNVQHCQVKGEHVCAYSKTDLDGITTINAWTDQPLSETYGVDTVQGEGAGYVSLAGVPAKSLTNPSLVVPAKNLLTNAEFDQFTTGDLIGWEILDANGVPIPSEPGFIQRNKPAEVLSILGGERLRTERISVGENMDLYFDINSTGGCSADITFVDQDGVIKPAALLNEGDIVNTANAAYFIFEIRGCEFSQPTIQYIDEQGSSQFGFKDPKDKPRAAAACCPENYCWNGYACSAPMTAFTTISEDAGNGKNYRCIGGQWTFQEQKTDWVNDEAGFCNEDTDCYVLSSRKGGDPANNASNFYQGNYPTCINSGEYIFDNYCNEGQWTSRTKFLASQLLEKVGENTDHTLYCTDFRDVFTNLNDDQLGKLEGVDVSLSTPDFGEEQAVVCFPQVSSGEGRRLISDQENTCINNACVVKVGQNTAFATTLNKKLDDPNSFTGALGRSTPTCSGTDDFQDCQDGLFYNERLRAVWFSKDNFNPNPGVFQQIVELFRSILEKEGQLTGENFFSKVENFREIYSFKQSDKRVLGLKEQLSRRNETLLVEFENFDTPVCEYFQPSRLNRAAFELELLQQASGMQIITCQEENGIQRVEATMDADFLWPHLTAKLRTSKE